MVRKHPQLLTVQNNLRINLNSTKKIHCRISAGHHHYEHNPTDELKIYSLRRYENKLYTRQ